MEFKNLQQLKNHLKENEGYTFISDKIQTYRQIKYYRVISERNSLQRIEIWKNANNIYFYTILADFSCNIDISTGKINDKEINNFIKSCKEKHKKVFEEKIISVQKSFIERKKRFKTIHC